MPCSLLVAVSGTSPLFEIAAARTFAKDSSESMTRIRLAMACFFCLSLESREYGRPAGSVNETGDFHDSDCGRRSGPAAGRMLFSAIRPLARAGGRLARRDRR